MKRILLSIAVAIFFGLTVSCKQESDRSTTMEQLNDESNDQGVEQTDTASHASGHEREGHSGSEKADGKSGDDTGTIGSPGSGYGTGNTSGSSPSGTSSPSGDATNDTQNESSGETDE